MAIVLTVYVRTMYQTVPGGDSGELIVGISLSISHTHYVPAMKGVLRVFSGCLCDSGMYGGHSASALRY